MSLSSLLVPEDNAIILSECCGLILDQSNNWAPVFIPPKPFYSEKM